MKTKYWIIIVIAVVIGGYGYYSFDRVKEEARIEAEDIARLAREAELLAAEEAAIKAIEQAAAEKAAEEAAIAKEVAEAAAIKAAEEAALAKAAEEALALRAAEEAASAEKEKEAIIETHIPPVANPLSVPPANVTCLDCHTQSLSEAELAALRPAPEASELVAGEPALGDEIDQVVEIHIPPVAGPLNVPPASVVCLDCHVQGLSQVELNAITEIATAKQLQTAPNQSTKTTEPIERHIPLVAGRLNVPPARSVCLDCHTQGLSNAELEAIQAATTAERDAIDKAHADAELLALTQKVETYTPPEAPPFDPNAFAAICMDCHPSK